MVHLFSTIYFGGIAFQDFGKNVYERKERDIWVC